MNILKLAIANIHIIGVSTSLAALGYARRRDRLNADYTLPPADRPQSPGKLLSAQITAHGARFQFEAVCLEITILQPGLVRLVWGKAPAFSYAVERTDWPGAEVGLSQENGCWLLSSPGLVIWVDAARAEIRFCDPTGAVLRCEQAPVGVGRGWRQSARLAADSCVYGLGERSAGLNLRPGSYRFWNTERGGQYGPGADPLYITMPVYLCSQVTGSHLAFYDNMFDGWAKLADSVEIQFEDGPVCYYLAFGDPPKLLELFTALTGRCPLPPRWALGYHQCCFGYKTQAEMERVFNEFQRRDLPLGALWLDADSFKDWCTFTLDEARYPDLPGLARRLAEKDVRLVVSTNPAIKIDPEKELYRQGLAEDAFCKAPDGALMQGVVWPGKTAFTDFTSPSVREWWGGQYAQRLSQGISGFWHDMNEPASFAAWGDMTLPLCTRHALEGQGGDHRQAHNVYGLQMDRAGFDGLRRLAPQKRPFILSRSGWVGMQRYAWTWTGDIESSWAIMRQTIACVLGLGLCGEPYGGPDIGGFSGHPDPELYVRWFELGSFLPFFRSHSTMGLSKREPWEFGPQVESILRTHLKNRVRLLPYWYTLAWETSQTGSPLVRPLFWADPSDSHLWKIEDAFLLGDSLLVAPVVQPGFVQRTLYLPGGRWIDFDNGRVYEGSQEVTLDAPLEHIPLLVKAGSMLPIQAENGLELHLFAPKAGNPGTGCLYRDAGDGYGPARVDQFELSPAAGGWAFSSRSEGAFPPLAGSIGLCLHGFEPGSLSILSPGFTLL